jgi:RNAse (barnase) inhibitor barstar
MPVETNKFAFDDAGLHLDPAQDFVARVPAGISNRAQLFQVLRTSLKLPSYFGNNWDALSDCLRDLSWIEPRRVAIIHEDVPRLDRESLSKYLDVLRDAVCDWKPDEAHELIAVFPAESRRTIDEAVPPAA